MADDGVAVLFSGDPRTGVCSMDVFKESDEHTTTWDDGRPVDPYHRAAALRDSVKDDFPDRVFTIHVNERARDLMANERMRWMGLL